MKTFDFSSLKAKYPLLSDKDVIFLNDFFNDGEIQESLKKLEIERKKYIKYLPVIAVISAIILILLFLSFPELVGFIIGGSVFLLVLTLFIVQKSTHISIKDKILSQLTQKISKKIHYKSDDSYFTDDLDMIIKNTKIISTYDRLDFKQDSIKMQDNEQGYTITGMEFQTSNRKQTEDSKIQNYNVNNHAYLMKIQFHNPKFRIEDSITLLAKHKYAQYFPYIVATGWTLSSLFPLFLGGRLWIFFGCVSFFCGVYFIFGDKNKVKLENVDFEKEFDTRSSDGVETRQIMTPDFMYRIYDYVNKIDPNRKYSLYFKDDYIYVKFDIAGTFLEVSLFQSLFKNLTQYVEFYLEMKNISELASDLKLGFYDKEFTKKKVIE